MLGYLIAGIADCAVGLCIGIVWAARMVNFKMQMAAMVLHPVIKSDTEFAKGAERAAETIFNEFGLYYK